MVCSTVSATRPAMRQPAAAAASGAAIGTLGGLIGLGGAEFRLPVLVALLGLPARAAVPMNLIVSLVTLLAALVGRSLSLPFGTVLPLMPEILGLIIGGMTSAVWGSGLLARLSDHRLSAVLALLLVAIGILLVIEALVPMQAHGLAPAGFAGRLLIAAVFGLVIGAVAALLGVAGGELLIPTFIFVFGAEVVTAGTASILVSIVLVITAIWRYGRLGMLPDRSSLQGIALPMGAGSIVGAVLGGLAVGLVAPSILKLILGAVLIVSAIKVFAKRPAH